MSMKYAVNSLQDIDPMTSVIFFIVYGFLSCIMVLSDGVKQEIANYVSLTYWHNNCSKMFKHLLNLDVNYHHSADQKTLILTLYKAQEQVNFNLRVLLNSLVPIALGIFALKF